MSSSGKIVAIGSERFITAFRLQGIDGHITTGQDFEKLIDFILKDETISIVILEEDLYYQSQAKMDKIKTTVERPLFIEVPIEQKKGRKDIIAELIRKNIGISLD